MRVRVWLPKKDEHEESSAGLARAGLSKRDRQVLPRLGRALATGVALGPLELVRAKPTRGAVALLI
jgi:hypothetical protein